MYHLKKNCRNFCRNKDGSRECLIFEIDEVTLREMNTFLESKNDEEKILI